MGHFWILNQNTAVFLLADLIWDSDLFRPSDQSGPKQKASPMLCSPAGSRMVTTLTYIYQDFRQWISSFERIRGKMQD